MKKAINTALLLIILFQTTSCLRLDDNLYNRSEKITEYKQDNYAGTPDFVLGPEYKIPDSLISVFTLNSKAPNENSATTIYATYIGSLKRIATDTVIMYCHGNRWHMDFYWQRAKLIANTAGKNHYGVMMVDYRGYGLSQGEPSEDGLYADVDAALAWLKSKGLDEKRLIMYGFSMGTAPATKLTAEPRSLRPSKLILEAPFASSWVMVEDATVLDMPGSYVTNLRIANAEEIKMVQQPFCWIHGTNDNFLNIKTNGEVVFANYKGTYSEAHRISGADHSNVPPTMGYITYNAVMEKFIKK